MSVKENYVTEEPETEKVNGFMEQLKHPMHDVAEFLRQAILAADKSVGEKIAWNAPAFFYTGKMKPFKPKEYKRFIVVFNFFKKDCIRLIFLKGALVENKSGLLEGGYEDGRRLMLVHGMDDAKKKEKELKRITKELAKLITKD